MKRCRLCPMPDTRPDTPFVDGICSACIAYAKRPTIDWSARLAELDLLLERGRNGSGFDCIVPSSGGKDSTYQVMTLIERGARPLVVTASTCHLTPIGRANIENLKRHATTIEVSPNIEVRAKLNRLGLELVGDISWPEHVAIFTIPLRVAAATGIPLLIYGENPQNQYGGPVGTEEARQLTRRWRSEFGGFLGLRPADMIGQAGITERDMLDYELLGWDDRPLMEAHFLGQYVPWDSHRNARIARAAGFQEPTYPPSPANFWAHENLDNAQTGLHDYGMFLKYGYGRGCAQVSVDVRAGRLSRDEAMRWVVKHDGAFPVSYAGVPLYEVLERIGMTPAQLQRTLDQFTNKALFRRVIDDALAPMMFLGAEGDGRWA